jgi:hypothetical protein
MSNLAAWNPVLVQGQELVRPRRLELPRAFAHNDLNVARLPVPPWPHAHVISGHARLLVARLL